MKTIYLLRHGRIMDFSSPKRYIGQTDLPLDDAGIRQARDLAEYFSRVPLDTIVCSNLKRSLQTARIIGENRRVKIEPFAALREVNLGEWEGLTFDAVKTKAPDEWRLRGETLADHRPPGAESFRDLQDRVMPLFEALAQETQGNFMIVGHAGVNRVILCHLLEVPLNRMFCLSQDYAAVNIIVCNERSCKIQLLNFTLN
jgi:probable phosphoglycerate mutase